MKINPKIILKCIRYYAWMSEVEGERVGTHKFSVIIRSSIHVHISHDICIEVLPVRGEGSDVKNLTEKIMTLRGVKHVKLTAIIPGEEI